MTGRVTGRSSTNGPDAHAPGVSSLVDGGVASICIARPDRRNALSLATWQELQACVAAAEADPAVRVLSIAGRGGDFGAGNDLETMAQLANDPEEAERFGFAIAAAIRSVEAASKPVIIAIQGVCYGAPVALALAGDIRLAADDATFAITPAKLGALYLRSDLHRLVAAVGPG